MGRVISSFLTPNLYKEIVIEAKGRTGTARLRKKPGRANKTLFYFEVKWDAAPSDDIDDPPRKAKAVTSHSGKRKAKKDDAVD